MLLLYRKGSAGHEAGGTSSSGAVVDPLRKLFSYSVNVEGRFRDICDC